MVQISLATGSGSAVDLTEIQEAIAELQQENVSLKEQVSTLTTKLGKKADTTALTTHASNTSNPHKVTLAQVGGKDFTSDIATVQAAVDSLTARVEALEPVEGAE